jgi:hypothetical protein
MCLEFKHKFEQIFECNSISIIFLIINEEFNYAIMWNMFVPKLNKSKGYTEV